MTEPATPEPEARCKLCGEPMPPGEEMFYYHGYSGDCPKPSLPETPDQQVYRDARQLLKDLEAHGCGREAVLEHLDSFVKDRGAPAPVSPEAELGDVD